MTSPSNSDSASVPAADDLEYSDQLGELLDVLTSRMLAGEPIDLEQLSQTFGQHADLLHELLPAMAAIAEFGGTSSDVRLPPNPPVRELGDFRIMRELGRGGMGVVYAAEQLSLGRQVALKILPFAAVLDPRQLQRFKNEALAAAHLNHPNIVEVYGLGCERSVHFYAMRLVDGVTLADVVRTARIPQPHDTDRLMESTDLKPINGPGLGPPPSQTAPTRPSAQAALSIVNSLRRSDKTLKMAEIGIQAAEALHHAHQMGIVHRDIKPSNLMLDERGKLWVTDFGLALNMADSGMTRTGDCVGTLRYMSPEQAFGKRLTLDHRTDIYSLGATLYELLTLRPAISGDDREETLKLIAESDPVPPHVIAPDLPYELSVVIAKAMEKDPDDRYATSQELADDLRRFFQNQPILAKPVTIGRRIARWSKNHSAVLLAAAVTLGAVALIAACTAFWIGRAYQEKSIAVERAERRGDLARRIIDDMFTQVARQWLANQQQMTPLQVEFLEKATAAYEELLSDEPNRAEIRYEYSQSLVTLSSVYRGLGRREEAQQLVIQALAICEQLAAGAPSNPTFRHGVASCLFSRSVLEVESGARASATESLQRAATIWNELAKQEPTNNLFLSSQVNALQNAALLVMPTDAAQSQQWLQQAAGGMEQLIERSPDRISYRIDTARIYVNLGVLVPRDVAPDRTVKNLRRAIDLLSPLAIGDNPSQEARHLLAGARLNLASVLRRAGRTAEATDETRASLQLAKALHDEFPEVPDYASLVRDSTNLLKSLGSKD